MAALTASLSSAFPVASIVILNQYEDIHTRLGILAIFTILFSVALAVLSPTKKLEVFAASAAYVHDLLNRILLTNIHQIRSSPRGVHQGLMNSTFVGLSAACSDAVQALSFLAQAQSVYYCTASNNDLDILK